MELLDEVLVEARGVFIEKGLDIGIGRSGRGLALQDGQFKHPFGGAGAEGEGLAIGGDGVGEF